MIYYTTKKDSLSILFLFRKKPAGACTHLPDALFCRFCLPSEAKEISSNKGNTAQRASGAQSLCGIA